MIVSIDVGLKTFTVVVMEGVCIKFAGVFDVSSQDKLRGITHNIFQVLNDINKHYKPSKILVES